EAEALSRPFGIDTVAVDARADEPELDVQRQVAARLVEPLLFGTQRRRVRLRLPGAAVGRLHQVPADARSWHRSGYRCGLVQCRGRWRAVRSRAREAAGLRDGYVLPAIELRQS